MTVQQIKQRFGIIGSSPLLERAINIAMQVASTDLTVLISGESGTGKEVFPQIIHQFSSRKHGQYIAVNCGAIPEGTIDSELFGHEKGSFTGAQGARKGYFEMANGGTIFLDEVAELPLQTQVRLLRVLETGEIIRVGSSKVEKTNVRIVAASNIDIPEAIKRGKFREDLFYRLNTIPITIPPLRQRKEDIYLLFRKFSVDFAEKYRMPSISLTEEAQQLLTNYYWTGNIRQLKNITEQISVIEKPREIDADTLIKYLPQKHISKLPVLYQGDAASDFSEREILYKVLFDMRRDIVDMKKLIYELIKNGEEGNQLKLSHDNTKIIQKLYEDVEPIVKQKQSQLPEDDDNKEDIQEHEEIMDKNQPTSLKDREMEMMINALKKYNNKRKYAAEELGISERTLYRKIKEYNIEEEE